MNWTRAEVLAALHLYMQLPFGQLHRGQPRIVQLARWLGRTPSSVAMKLVNIASLDPAITGSGRAGLTKASKLDRDVWAEVTTSWSNVLNAASAAYERFAVSTAVGIRLYSAARARFSKSLISLKMLVVEGCGHVGEGAGTGQRVGVDQCLRRCAAGASSTCPQSPKRVLSAE